MSCRIQKQEISSVKGQLFQIKFNNYCESMSKKCNLNESDQLSDRQKHSGRLANMQANRQTDRQTFKIVIYSVDSIYPLFKQSSIFVIVPLADTPTFSMTTLFQRPPLESLIQLFSFSNGLKLPWTLGRVETGRQVQKHILQVVNQMNVNLSTFNSFRMLRFGVSFAKKNYKTCVCRSFSQSSHSLSVT